MVGVTGSGKTTLAADLARRLSMPHVELDALHWEPGWSEAPLETFRSRVQKATAGAAWVVDGNYGKAHDLLWPLADTLIWLDYPLWLCLWQLTRRTLIRILKRETLWNGNRETIWGAFFAKDSLFGWAIKSHKVLSKRYPAWLAQPEYAHLSVYRLRNHKQTKFFLSRLGQQALE